MATLISNPLAAFAVLSALLAALLLGWFLLRRPALGPATKLILLMGIGVFPIATAGTAPATSWATRRANRATSAVRAT